MESSSRLVSSRAGGPRPMTSARPITGVRPITSTGLVAPKSSRGRTGLRRQVQDKTYWISIIKAKMSELTAEISTLSRDQDTLSKDEARMGVWQKKAESLARELGTLSHELAILNEFRDRIRVGENGEEIKEEIGELQEENEELSSKLEDTYEEKKQAEELIMAHEQDIEQMKRNWENLKRQFTPEQQMQYNELEKMNQELTFKCEQFDRKISNCVEKRKELENLNRSGSDSFLRKEILQALDRLRELEKQRDHLIGESNTDERAVLLAQVKRDNKEITAGEAKMSELDKETEEIKSELEAYEDTEAAEKYRELKQKEVTMDAFLAEFEDMKREEEQKINDLGATVDVVLAKINRIIAHIDGLKVSQEDEADKRDGVDGLVDEKRKLELDMNKIEQLEAKINSELDSLRNKIKSLEKDIQTYSDIPKLKREVEERTEKLKDERDKLKEQLTELKKASKELKEKLDTAREGLDSNQIYTAIKEIESKLSEVLATNVKIESQIGADDTVRVKKLVLEEVKKYNQKLQGY